MCDVSCVEQKSLCDVSCVEQISLFGALECDCEKLTLDELLNKHPDIELGGRIRPSDCRAAQRTAIIIPFRDCRECLYILMNMLIPILKRQHADVTVFVIEQSSESEFNRAALQNVGFLEAKKTATFDCFIFHDVEMVPLSDHIMYRCGPAPSHLVANIQLTNGNPKATYENYTGGVTAFTARQYQAINGNSNLYFGWGGDDDDLHDRIVHKQMTIRRTDSNLGSYRMLTEQPQKSKAANPHRWVHG
ncbi:unnamed protein product [Candidula unifasciata]|uniref:Beta-1,4-N-acetylgalactosaminyltransferase bre-4 n=1 Tax=Candidula unifasciata TaxID=100452 RepID=A0A8S3YIW7_9EUPU|nr:unnamed protein product [Candidula unifasciata]